MAVQNIYELGGLTGKITYAPKKLDIGCGIHPEKGYTGIDIEPNADIVWDLFTYPWPIKTGSVSTIRINHFAEHIPHYRPEWGTKDGWFWFWEEVYRITRKGAVIDIVHPYVKSDRAFWDPTHVRFIHEVTWYYLDKNWREANGLGHYTDCDFEAMVASQGIYNDMQGRSDEYVAFHREHSWNVYPDLVVKLKRR